jgi:putative NIF3 family GTP cyclohydrolase 1 type 2
VQRTVKQVIDTIAKATGVPRIDPTVDTIKFGDPSIAVTGIVTTFLANRHVIDKAVALKANFIITHEPTFYKHEDDADWLKNDPVYKSKIGILEAKSLVIWRFHDIIHAMKPDGIVAGIENRLGWEKYRDNPVMNRYMIPQCTLSELSGYLKNRLEAHTIRVAGDLSMKCTGVGLLIGAQGGQVQLLGRPDIDVVVCGETAEWEACEYVRDSLCTDQPKALIVLGHQPSEEAGMEWVADWLKPLFPGVPVTHVSAGNPLIVI